MNQSKKKSKNHNKYNNKQKLTKNVVLQVSVPDTVAVPLAYQQSFNLSGSIIMSNVFNLNSVFDPDATGGGHQPLAFDQWSAFYNRYRVDDVLVEIDFVNGSNIITDCLVIASNSTASISTSALFLSACESPYAWNKLCATATQAPSLIRMKKKYSLNAVTGVTRAKYIADDQYSADVSADPVEDIVLHVVVGDMLNAYVMNMNVRVKLTYYTTFFDRKQLAQS